MGAEGDVGVGVEVSAGIDPATGAWWLLSLMASHRFRSAVMPNRKQMEANLATMARAALTDRWDGFGDDLV